MNKEETITLTLRIPISTKLRLEMIANKENRTLNSLVGKVIQDYIETEDGAKKIGLHN